jgi:hypothetical protein
MGSCKGRSYVSTTDLFVALYSLRYLNSESNDVQVFLRSIINLLPMTRGDPTIQSVGELKYSHEIMFQFSLPIRNGFVRLTEHDVCIPRSATTHIFYDFEIKEIKPHF